MARAWASGESLERALGYLITIIIIVSLVLIAAGKIRIAVVEGRSMEPTMHTGDLVFLRSEPPEKIKPGDVVVYKTDGRYIIHRVINVYIFKGNYCYIIKGDNNPVPDPGFPACGSRGIPYSAIIGVVYSVDGSVVKIPYLGGISVMVKG
ncbi:MAG: signal peptidase I [Desulfurococcales archaeon]|nr:signal peptidase I [Desulfurococcales archaeon]